MENNWISPDDELPPEKVFIEMKYQNQWGEEWIFAGQYKNEQWWNAPLVVLSTTYGKVVGWRKLEK